MMSRTVSRNLAAALLAVTVCSGAVAETATRPTLDRAESAVHGIVQPARVLRFDVAESMPKFVFDEAPLLPNGLPAYGNPFITQGYLYPAGTLEGGTGVLADGSPEFPDLVIGEWTCRGYFVGDGADTQSGPWVMTTQHYDFYDEPGYAAGKQSSRRNLVTEGYELSDVGVASTRAITGGTGRFQRARGQATQTLLGFNASEGVNLRFSVRIR